MWSLFTGIWGSPRLCEMIRADSIILFDSPDNCGSERVNNLPGDHQRICGEATTRSRGFFFFLTGLARPFRHHRPCVQVREWWSLLAEWSHDLTPGCFRHQPGDTLIGSQASLGIETNDSMEGWRSNHPPFFQENSFLMLNNMLPTHSYNTL